MVIYRVAGSDELQDVSEVLRSSFPVYDRIKLDPEYLRNIAEIDPGVRKGLTYVAELNGRIVSTLQVVHRELSVYPSFLPVAGIANVATLPQYRGQGLARNLVSYALHDLRDRGYSATALFVGYGEPAHRIYRRLGYHDIIVYWNRVCVLDDIVQAIDWLEKHLPAQGMIGDIRVIEKPWKAGIEGNLKILYYRLVNKKYRGSTYRNVERWRGILTANPFETWFLGDPTNKVIVVTNGGVHGYAITYYVKSSVLSRSHDLGLGIVTEIVTHEVVDAVALLNAIYRKALDDNIGTLTFRPPPELDEYLPVCKVIGSPETFMARILDYEKLVRDINRFLVTRPVEEKITFCVRSRDKCAEFSMTRGSVSLRLTPACNCDIVMDEGAFLRVLFSTMTTYDEYRLGYLNIKQPNIRRTLETLNNILKGRRRHYLSLIDKW